MLSSSVVVMSDSARRAQSSGGVMGVRGRGERIAFAESFTEIYHFRNLYSSSTFMYPIRGALRMSHAGTCGVGACDVGAAATWVLFARRQTGSPDGVGVTEFKERYEPVGVFPKPPEPAVITRLIMRGDTA